jgi:flagellar basal-body rod modification protein FlgD
MMISPIQAIQSASSQTSETTTQKSSDNMGKNDFLKIFLAQMRNQDPLSPMEGTEFTAQLAQFSSLEQLFNVNDNLESLKGAQGDTSKYDALNFIGKDIVAGGDQLSLSEPGIAKGGFQIQAPATCTVSVMDGSGNLVRTIPLGLLDAGQHAFEWDGMNSSGLQSPAGIYGFTVNALDETGSPVLADTMTSGKVTRVNLEGDTPILYVGDIPVNFNQVLDISLPEESQES